MAVCFAALRTLIVPLLQVNSLDMTGQVTGLGKCFIAVMTLKALLSQVNIFDMTGECTGMAEYLTALSTLMLLTQVDGLDMTGEYEYIGLAESFATVGTLMFTTGGLLAHVMVDIRDLELLLLDGLRLAELEDGLLSELLSSLAAALRESWNPDADDVGAGGHFNLKA